MKEITFITNIPYFPLYITNNNITKKYICSQDGKLTILLKSFCVYKIKTYQKQIIIYTSKDIPSIVYLIPNCNQIKKQITIILTDQNYFGQPIKKGMIIYQN